MNVPNRKLDAYQTRSRVKRARKYLADRSYLSEVTTDELSPIGKLTFHIPNKMSNDQAHLLLDLAFNGMRWN